MLLLLVKRKQLKRLENCAQRDDGWLTVKSQLIAIAAAVLLVGCGPSVDIYDAAYEGNIETVKQHLAAGTDVNAKDKDGWTPLHNAAYKGHKEIALLVIAKGADVNATDGDGDTPLHLAGNNTATKEIAELLIAKGADVNAMNLSPPGREIGGMTPLDMAILGNRNEIADLLRKHGGKTAEELK